TLELSRDPDLFRIVLDYLSGYVVFPLSDKHIPLHSSSQVVLQNLVADATFYELRGFLKLCQDHTYIREPTPVEEMTPPPPPPPPPRPTYLALTSVSVAPVKYVDEGYPFLQALDSYFPVPVPEDKLNDPAFASLVTPDSCSTFSDYRTLSAINVVIASRVPDLGTWKLRGWKLTKNGTKCEIVIVVESRGEEDSSIRSVKNVRYTCQPIAGKTFI
ncbi:hypothetical protein BDV93DRAFT_221604, partial [Ceratobasidium sp. AG-I]